MGIEYKCVVADHDDTAVDSSKVIHYPIYLEIMAELRPDVEPMSADGFIEVNRRTSLRRHYFEDLDFSEGEWKYASEFWLNHKLRFDIPKFYDGFLNMMSDFKSNGGIYTVVSHSDEGAIRRHYNHVMNGASDKLLDMVFGSSTNSEHNKPNPWPLDRIMEEYMLKPEDIFVIDDLEPGIEMAEKRGVDTVGVGWSHDNPDTFKKRCTFYASEVEDLRKILF